MRNVKEKNPFILNKHKMGHEMVSCNLTPHEDAKTEIIIKYISMNT